MSWGRVPLRYQVALVVGLVIAGLLATFSTVLYAAVRQSLLAQREEQLQTAALTAINADLTPGDRPSGHHQRSTVAPDSTLVGHFDELVTALTEPRMSATIYGLDGAVLVRGKTAARSIATILGTNRLPLAGPQPSRAQITKVVNSDHQLRYIHRGASTQIVLLMPLYNGQAQIAAVLQLASPLRPTEQLLARLVQYLFVGTTVSVMAGMLISTWATGQVLRPLRRIVRASERVGRGDLDTRVNLPPGNEIGQLGSAWDKMVEQTAESFHRQQRFVANAAHDLRTPLTAIGGSIEMLQMGAVDDQPERRRRLLTGIGNEVDRLGRLVNDLLLLSHLDQQPPQRTTDLDLRPLLLELVEQTRIVAPDHHFVVDLPQPLALCGNEDQLRQVFLNLLSNAHTYTAVGGTITVSGCAEREITVRVADTGVGIPPNELPRVWDRLYRVDRSRGRAKGGFGLGLAIVQSIVTAHGGQVGIYSVVGQGTVVTITLPRRTAAAQLSAGSSANL